MVLYIYILYTLCNMISVYIYIYICIHHIILWWYFSPAGHFCLDRFGSPVSLGPSQVIMPSPMPWRQHRSWRDVTRKARPSCTLAFRLEVWQFAPLKKVTIFTRGDFLNGNLFLEDQSWCKYKFWGISLSIALGWQYNEWRIIPFGKWLMTI